MAQQFRPTETEENDALLEGVSESDGTFVEQAKMTRVRRSLFGVTAVAGALLIVIWISVMIGSWSNTMLRASPAQSILAAEDACIEENVAYGLGKITQGKSEWLLQEGKKPSAHECQIWCQIVTGCEFFTFRKRSKKCTLTNNRGEKRAKGNNGAISGPKFCALAVRPCQEYVTTASRWGQRWGSPSTFSSHLDGELVTVSTHTMPRGSSNKLDERMLGYPAWIKGMPLPTPLMMDHGKESQWKGFNITVHGAPMENLILMYNSYLPPGKQWNATLSNGKWIKIHDYSGWFRTDLIDGGRTVFTEMENMPAVYMALRLSEPVSQVSVSVSTNVLGNFALMLFKGKNCE